MKLKIIDEALMQTFRRKTHCEFCGRKCPYGTDPHHAFVKRGVGGGTRLDVVINLISLCRGYHKGVWKSCHQDAEEGRIPKGEILAVIARRERLTVEEIQRQVWDMLRAPKVSPGQPGAD